MKKLLLVLLFLSRPLLAQQTPYLGAPVQLPGVVQAENYDLGGDPAAWHDRTPGNVFGVYRNHDVDVGSIFDGGGGYHIGYVENAEYAEYTVNVSSSGSYNLRIRYASAYTGTTRFKILLDTTNLT